MNSSIFKSLKSDLPASLVVFFVALPLCLGIALASGAPLFSGLIAGIIGGIVVGALSGSNIGVSGPAAGLAAIVLTSIGTLGGFENFLLAVVIAGLIQIAFGLLKAGVIGYYFPSAVIKGMLTGIGIIIILKQIPHFFGYDADPEGDLAFRQLDGHNTFTELLYMFENVSVGPTIVAVVGLLILLIWDNVLAKRSHFFKLIQGPLVAVGFGIGFQALFANDPNFGISAEHLVSVPVPSDMTSFFGQFSLPNFSAIVDTGIWITAFTIALVASLETLLCVEATDKLDPAQGVTPTNRELIAQGTGNMISGLIGGLPITQVIVRSSANIQSGGKSKMSAIIHGFLLLGSVLLIPNILNMIPLSVLASILLIVGYKLAKPANFKDMYSRGWSQFVPFMVTIIGIIFTDLLVGIALGLMVGIVIILYKSYLNTLFLHIEDKSDGVQRTRMTLAEEVTFFKKGAIMKELDALPPDSILELDVSNTQFMDHDILDLFVDFSEKAKDRRIHVQMTFESGSSDQSDEYLKMLREFVKS